MTVQSSAHDATRASDLPAVKGSVLTASLSVDAQFATTPASN